ncbi:PAS domain S-box protein [Pedobacter psychroterrae]|uniref:histidine kinase n=1 Tax=Pedobacter psychroterrae TaxID=2530453 RepID=A0A4R0NMX9_9SPHI|nr:PAS domain S-box protein [Pedobacter psychroterrae]TCD01288.1 PAS domain S-box protein [Pedobacter psychroterrae]
MINIRTSQNRFVFFAATLVIGIGVLVMIGWFAHIPILTSFINGYATMKINTAFGLILLGSALLIQIVLQNKKWLFLARIFSLLTIALGTLTLAQDIFNINLKLDEIFTSDFDATLKGNPNPGRMSPIAAICFVAMGTFLLAHLSQKIIYRLIAQWSTHLVTFFTFLAIVGYLFNVPVFYKLSFLTSMAVHTSLCLFVLSISASLIHPSLGISGIFTGTRLGNVMARKLFMQMTIAVLILTFLRIESDRLKLVSVEFGIVLFAISFIMVSLFLIWRTAEAMNKSDLKKSKAEFNFAQIKAFLNSTPDPILILNSSGIIQLVNDRTEMVFGYSKDELIGRNINILVPERFRNSQSMTKLLDSVIDESELFALSKDGLEIPVEVNLSPFEANELDFISASIRDVSERRKIMSALKTSEKRNRIFIEQSPNAIAMYDADMQLMAASKKWITDYQIEDREIIGRTHYEIFPEIGEDWKKIHNDCLKGAIHTCDEAEFEREDGSTQWITWDVRPWYASEDHIGGIIMYTADITVSKQKDAERRKIENILERSNQVAKIAHWEIDAKTGKVSWSKLANEIYELPDNYQPDRESILKFYKKGPNLDKLLLAVEESKKKGKSYDLEVELVTAKGNNKWIRIIGDAEFKKGFCIRRLGIFQDITKTKKIEEDIIRINEELNVVLNSGHVSIIGTDPNGVITHFSSGAEKLLLYQKSEMVGIQSPEILHLQTEVELRGSELSTHYGREISGFDVFTEPVRTGSFDSHEWSYVRKDGTIFPVQLVVTALRNGNGEIYGFLGVATDISDIKKAEKELVQLMEITNGQNERLKNFAHIVSHNLRSHAGNFAMMLDLLAQEEPEIAEHEYIKLVKKASDNLTETIANLNEVVLMNTAVEQNLVPIELKHAVSAAIQNVSILIKDAEITITNDVEDEVKVLGVSAYIDSIVLNFITNGIKYRALDRPGIIKLSSHKENNWVVLTVEDNGVGIDLIKHGAKLFGMYKTFHPNPDARGIGLFITKNQVEALGGKIDVSSVVNEGTIFKIFLKHEKS